MPGPLAKLVSHQSSYFATGDAVLTEPGSSTDPENSSPHTQARDFFSPSPCVLYECNAAFEFTRVSENISELFGLNSTELIGSRLLSDQRIPVEDLALLTSKLEELGGANTKTSLIHRILDRRGLPLWVAHRFWKVALDSTTVIQGCIVPMDYSGRLSASEQAVISRFIHKMGNHFQLLNLVINSLKRTLPESKEISLLQETVEKAIEHTRGFSDYNQVPTCLSRVDLADILQSAVMPWRSSFEKKDITFETEIHDSIAGAIIQADPYLLDLAIGYVLQNALEATGPGGRVILDARVKCLADGVSAGTISVIDSGCGIDENTLKSVMAPFFTSKKNHEGLGLSMASRFVEIHGGILRLTSAPGKGAKVEMVLPVEVERRSGNLF
ncbi:MAG TPA: PAS domain-containing sensor histidine kinase [Candidatus Binatia bacterium]